MFGGLCVVSDVRKLSGKLSASLIRYLDKYLDTKPDFDALGEGPSESVLTDPSAWVEASAVEAFLQQVHQAHSVPGGNVVESAGRGAADLRAWGFLDGVLELMSGPEKIFSQPQKFLEYFIHPAFLQSLGLQGGEPHRAQGGFYVPWPHALQNYPMADLYLRAAFGALPTFMHKPLCVAVPAPAGGVLFEAVVTQEAQEARGEPDAGGPMALHQLLDVLEAQRRKLEEKEQQMQAKAGALALGRRVRLSRNDRVVHLLMGLSKDFLQLSDYFVRARQLMKLFAQQDLSYDARVQAMRKWGWKEAEDNFDTLLFRGLESLHRSEKLIRRGGVEPNASAHKGEECRQLEIFTPESLSTRADSQP